MWDLCKAYHQLVYDLMCIAKFQAAMCKANFQAAQKVISSMALVGK